MDEALKLLSGQSWRVIDQSGFGPEFDPLSSFAIDDTLCKSAGNSGAAATARSWVHDRTVVLGIQDTKLNGLKAGLDYLAEQNYRYIVRNSGGLAVVLDSGVLNLSLVFPDTEKGIDINRGYDAMWLLIRRMFSDFPAKIEAREIEGSYCPGSYDLSINGKKFAGISQRRIRKGVAVQIYLCVNGNGPGRAELIREFYARSGADAAVKYVYPAVRPDVMASLEELLSVPLSIKDVMMRFLTALKELGGELQAGSLQGEELEWYEEYMERMEERNRKAFPWKYEKPVL